ncbi:MAG: HEPN domain-containing protein [Gammaproteobacteria bacterium]|nr:HEPN domain-containing protein [Gammaproteobacteria bacterium]
MSEFDSLSSQSAAQLANGFEVKKSMLSDRNTIRLRRALSWLEKAQTLHSHEDFDGAFIFFWIAFNSMYSIQSSVNNPPSDTSQFRQFFKNLLQFDTEGTIYNALWKGFPGAIRTLVQNKYVYSLFWEFQMTGNESDWETQLKKSEVRALAALRSTRREKTLELLLIVFDRLYTLRNQLIHGSATYQGSINRDQVKDGASILAYLVPSFVAILLENSDHDWGEVTYPAISRQIQSD